MTGIPNSLADAIAQAGQATVAALDDGLTRLQVSLLLPELKAETFAAQIIKILLAGDRRIKVFFPDMGAAALAKRNWGDVPFEIMDVGSGRTPVGKRVTEEDGLLLFVEPSAVEVLQVEELCNQAGDRPVIFLNPNLEDIATIGIGYAGRQLRERFLSQIQDAYHLAPNTNGYVLAHAYPNPWQVWGEPQAEGETYVLLGERSQRPAGDVLDGILMGTAQEEGEEEKTSAVMPQRNLFDQMQRFLQALTR